MRGLARTLLVLHKRETFSQRDLGEDSFMKRIEAIIKSFKISEVKARLFQVGARGMTAFDVRECSHASNEAEEDQDPIHDQDFVRRTRIQVVVDDEMVYPMVEAIMAAARTGEPGDGEILVSPVSEVVRIRTGERGIEAL
jgi:nitrogen regulatory protein P-II 1